MQVLDGPKSTIYALAFAPDGRLAVGDKDGRLTVWDATGQANWTSPLSDALKRHPKYGVAFLPNGDLLYTHWGQVLSETPDHEPGGIDVECRVEPIAVAAVGAKFVVVGCGSRLYRQPGELLIWDAVRDRKRSGIPEPHGVRAVAAHSDSHQVAWATAQSRVSVWDITRPDPIHFPLKENSPAAAFSPDGQTLAAAVGWTVTLFDIRAKRERRTLTGHTGAVTAVAFSPDGRTLTTGSWDGTVRAWEPDTGAERAVYRWPVGRVFSLAYDADGLRLAAGGDQGQVVVWDAS